MVLDASRPALSFALGVLKEPPHLSHIPQEAAKTVLLVLKAGIIYNADMVTLDAHFDGKTIIPDEPSSLPFPSGTRLRVNIEPIEETHAATPAPQSLQPLNIQIEPELSNAIALDPAFNIEES